MVPYGTRMATVAIAVALTCVAWGEAPEPSPTNRFVVPGDASAPAPQPSHFALHFTDVDFSQFAEAAGQSTGRSMVIGPGVCGLVSVDWETVLTAAEFYEAFVSIARTMGFTVVEKGSVTTVTLDDSARKGSPESCRRYPV